MNILKTHYIFPAVFEYDQPDNIIVFFPDLPGCISVGENTEDALRMAKEALSLHLYGMEQDDDKIPSPSNPEDIELDQNNLEIVMVEVWMTPIREYMEKSITKTVTTPYGWMMQQKNIN